MPINSNVLRWARQTAGYNTIEEIEAKGFPKFALWEDGSEYPTYSQLEKIANTLHRPIAIFFFPELPVEESIEKSLRAISEDDVHNLSPVIRQLFRKAKAFQISLHELLSEEQAEQQRKIQWLQLLSNNNIKQVADKTRKHFGITLSEQSNWKNYDHALKNWRDILADNGIYVFKEAFKNKNVAGFCIYDEMYPIIFINNSMEKSRQIFTLFHELAHIIFKQSYLDIFDNNFWMLEHKDPSHVEVKCNAFAAEFLVPESDFDSKINGIEINDANISNIANLYHVSREVILRKCLTNKLISKNFYEEKIKEWYKNFLEKEPKESADEAGGNWYNSKMAYLGDAYLSIVLQKYNRGKISIEEAASHLDVKVRNFSTIEEKFLSRGALDVYI